MCRLPPALPTTLQALFYLAPHNHPLFRRRYCGSLTVGEPKVLLGYQGHTASQVEEPGREPGSVQPEAHMLNHVPLPGVSLMNIFSPASTSRGTLSCVAGRSS